jgi:hypothetical protein
MLAKVREKVHLFVVRQVDPAPSMSRPSPTRPHALNITCVRAGLEVPICNQRAGLTVLRPSRASIGPQRDSGEAATRGAEDTWTCEVVVSDGEGEELTITTALCFFAVELPCRVAGHGERLAGQRA